MASWLEFRGRRWASWSAVPLEPEAAGPWTAVAVKARLQWAYVMIERAREQSGERPALGHRQRWAVGETLSGRRRGGALTRRVAVYVTPDELEAAEAVWRWLEWIDNVTVRRAVELAAAGRPSRDMARPLGCSHVLAQRLVMVGLVALVDRLHIEGVELPGEKAVSKIT